MLDVWHYGPKLLLAPPKRLDRSQAPPRWNIQQTTICGEDCPFYSLPPSEWFQPVACWGHSQSMKSRIFFVVELVALALVYFCCGRFGLSLAFVNPNATAVWPPTGVALVALLVRGQRLWPGVFLGAFLVNFFAQGSFPTSLGIAAGNTLEAVLGAWLVSRYANGAHAFERTTSIFNFIFLAALGSTLASATCGVSSLCLGGFARWDQFGPIWLTWWLGDM